ncbi:MAG: polysaccharide deacetylase family protein [Armatimonadetes bacterium]|nr:polysaccharide deacetylase family protein [Armatimonadota bacterium]
MAPSFSDRSHSLAPSGPLEPRPRAHSRPRSTSSAARRAPGTSPAKLGVGWTLVAIAAALVLLHLAPARVGPALVRPGQPLGPVLASLAQRDPSLRGDLLDVTGAVLKRGGGGGPRAWRRGVYLPASYVLHPREGIHVLPGPDRVEPHREVVQEEKDGRRYRVLRYVQGLASGKTTKGEDVTVVTQPAPVRIALTFDDGPHPRWTPQVLDLLARYHAHATFFVLGLCARGHPELVERELDEGHEIGAHTYNHPHLPRLSDGAIAAEMSRFEAVVFPLMHGRKIRWLRPPYGAVSSRVRALLARRGYRVILWDVDTNDWRKPPPSVLASRILRGARNGRVILMHDGGGDRSRTVQALAQALPELERKGVQMVTLSQLKGLEPMPLADIFVMADGKQWRGKPKTVNIRINGTQLPEPVAAVAMEGQLLVAVGPVLKGFHLPYKWQPELLALRIEGVQGPVTLRVNSRRATVADRDVTLLRPVLRLKGQVLAGVTLLARITGSIARVAASGESVVFETPDTPPWQDLESTFPAPAEPLLMASPD